MPTIDTTPKPGTAAYVSAAYNLLGTLRDAWTVDDIVGVECTPFMVYIHVRTVGSWRRVIAAIDPSLDIRVTDTSLDKSIHHWADVVIDGITVRAIYLEGVAS